jgi:hypothetical protein
MAEHLVGWFGVEQFEAYRGKEGVQLHGVDELAAVLLVKLVPVLHCLPETAIAQLYKDGRIAQPLAHPWDKTT